MWNHRVIRRSDEANDVTQYSYAIHEVYEDGHWTEDPVEPLGTRFDDQRDEDGISELVWSLEAMTQALEQPILEEYEEEGKWKLREIKEGSATNAE